jgi:hypothetical protein
MRCSAIVPTSLALVVDRVVGRPGQKSPGATDEGTKEIGEGAYTKMDSFSKQTIGCADEKGIVMILPSAS